jgi:hypothetical protein
VAGQNRLRFVDEQRVGPNPVDALHQASDLGFRMSAWIARKGLQLANGSPDNPFRKPAGLPQALRTMANDHRWPLGAGLLRHSLDLRSTRGNAATTRRPALRHDLFEPILAAERAER